MKRSLRVLIPLGLIVAGLPIRAHHAIAEIYDEERTLVLEGEVASFLFGNPHSIVHLRVRDPRGSVHTWAVEWRAAERLRRQGLRAEALRPGDLVTVCGHPGRDPGDYRLHLLNVARLSPGAPLVQGTKAARCSQ